jgi:hypothetical protein
VEHALGNRAATPAPPFDRFPLDEPEWPRQLEFTLSNRCNLACVQCNPDNSSTIRKREGLAPLPMPYGDRFFEELVPFLEHVEVCAFLGGEPFLTPQARRVWDLLIERRRSPIVQVTTNATVWNESVERYVHELRMDLALSIDGATAETYEAIRLGARHDKVVAIRDRMVAAARTYGGIVHLNYCLMRANWHEVGRFCRQADELDVDANMIPVWGPPPHSLFTLGRTELAAVVAGLEAEDRALAPTLGRNRGTWDSVLALLRDQLERVGSDHGRPAVEAAVKEERRRLEAQARRRAEEELERRLAEIVADVEQELADWAGRDCIEVVVDDGRVASVRVPAWAEELDPQRWVGLDPLRIADEVAGRMGQVEQHEPEQVHDPADVTVTRATSTLRGDGGAILFRAVHVNRVDRLFIATREDVARIHGG